VAEVHQIAKQIDREEMPELILVAVEVVVHTTTQIIKVVTVVQEL
jgi:hypothetical protein